MRLLILFFLFTSFSFGQKTIYFISKKDGTEYKAKRYYSDIKFLKITTTNGNVIKLPYEQLEKIEYKYQKNKRSKVENIKKIYVKISKDKGLLVQVLKEGKCNLYVYLTSQGNKHYCVTRENEQVATPLYLKQVISNNFKKAALNYFKDCQEVIKRIKSKEFNKKNIPDMIDFYNKNCL